MVRPHTLIFARVMPTTSRVLPPATTYARPPRSPYRGSHPWAQVHPENPENKMVRPSGLRLDLDMQFSTEIQCL